MIQLLPRTPRGTWLLAGAVWLAGVGALWWVLPYRPRAAWSTEEPAVVHGFIPGTAVLLTSSPANTKYLYLSLPMDPLNGPLLARDAATGGVRTWFPRSQSITLVNPGVDGRHVLIGCVVDGRARLFLHDAADGTVIAQLPPGELEGVDANDDPPDPFNQFAAFRPDGRQIVYAHGSADRRRLRIWDVETKQEVAALRHAWPPVAWSPDGRSLACGTQMRGVWSVQLWDLATGQSRPLGSPLPEDHRPERLAFSPDGKRVVAMFMWTSDRRPNIVQRDRVQGWNAISGAESYQMAATTVAFPPGMPWFATDDFSDTVGAPTVHRRDYTRGNELGVAVLTPESQQTWLTLCPRGQFVFGMAVHENRAMELINQHILGRPPGEFTNTFVQLWDVESGRQRYALPMTSNDLFSYGWRSDGKMLAVAAGKELTVWDVPPRKPALWFAAAAALFALPTFLIARRRVRRLRREAAA